jgi:hypothetical protein
MLDIEKLQKLVEYVLKNFVAVVIGAIIGGIAIVALYHNGLLQSGRGAKVDAQYETWDVIGAVDLQSGAVPYEKIIPSIVPPALQVKSDGTFTATVLVEVKNGQRNFPDLIFGGIAGHGAPVVHIASTSQTKLPFGAVDYKADYNEMNRKIHLNKMVVFPSIKSMPPVEPGQTQDAKQTGAKGGQR